MTTIKVHAFDPGVTSGYATGIIENGHMGVVSGQAKWSEWPLYCELKRSKPDIIIYETFEYRNTRGRQQPDAINLFPRNLIGVLNLYVQETSTALYTQTPAQAKGSPYNDQRLKREHLYKITDGGHANDAMRHLLYWFTFGSGYQFNTKGYKGLA